MKLKDDFFNINLIRKLEQISWSEYNILAILNRSQFCKISHIITIVNSSLNYVELLDIL